MSEPLETGLGSGNVPYPEDYFSNSAENMGAGPITRSFAAIIDCHLKLLNLQQDELEQLKAVRLKAEKEAKR